jgi:hypothetical protein
MESLVAGKDLVGLNAHPHKWLRRRQLREAQTAFARMPWEIRRFILDYLRCQRCEVTLENCEVIAQIIEARLRRGPVCYACLSAMLEQVVIFE